MVHLDLENTPDEELMRLARRSREDAFAALIARHQHALVNLFRRLGADAHEADDCAQETFLRLFRYRDHYRPTGPFRAFLFTLARHAWTDAVRRRGRWRRGAESGAREDLVDPAPATARRLDLDAGIGDLPEHLRWVVVLSVDEGLSYAEIGRVLDVPVGTVKSRMFHAVRRLKETFGVRLER